MVDDDDPRSPYYLTGKPGQKQSLWHLDNEEALDTLVKDYEVLHAMAERERHRIAAHEQWRAVRNMLFGGFALAFITAAAPPWLFIWLWHEARPWLHGLIAEGTGSKPQP